MDDRDDQIDEFCLVTGATRERAQFFLQASNGNLQAALDGFYNEDSVQNEESEATPSISPPPAVKPVPEKHKVASLSDYTSSKSTKEDEGQSFFAGGSEHSGQLISGPPRKKKEKNDLAKEVFDAAKKQGAVPVEDIENLRDNDRKFTGTGFRLGDTEGPSDYVPGIRVTIGKEKATKKLVFWKNGFTVDDGPLRTGQTTEDRQFLESVSKGEIPSELTREADGGEVDIDLEDKRNEDFVQKKPKLVPFSGAGQKLGNITPNLIDPSVPPVATSTSTGTSSMIVVDHTKPVTSVQIRLADGQRLVGKFNHTHTVADIRQFIMDSHPEMKNKNFILLTTFPNRTLNEVSLSLAEANLLNAVVVQRFT